MTNMMKKGYFHILSCCKNAIREIEGYVWDSKEAIKGNDKPVKQADHQIDSLRYILATHKVASYKNNFSQTNTMQNDIGYRPVRRSLF